jgi:3'(2'), 5'-bisphosphate nucleotidase
MQLTVQHMIKAALAAGSEVMDVYSGEIAVEHKDDQSPLTEADRRSHDTIETMLQAAMNSGRIEKAPILSEEGTTIPFPERAGWQRFFLIDPLDGTKEFIKRNGEFTVNIALIERDGAASVAAVWKPVAGVVYAPDLGELFVGSPEGAWWWGDVRGLTVPDISDGETMPRPTLGSAGAERPFTIVASRSHMSPETEDFVAQRRREHPDLDLISAGSSLKLCRVADGSADEYPRFAPTMEWDTAAGDAVARAAGCQVFAWNDGDDGTGPGGPLVYNKEDMHNPWFVVRRVR